MKLPLAWLKTFVPKLPSPQKLADLLAMHGLEVEDIIDYRGQFDRVVVGKVTAVRPHPNADKLRLADVITMPNGPSQEIVCGAPNVAVGQKVPVALLGATLPNGMTIESRPIRGIISNGMLCAEDELGLGQSHAGIMVLDSALQPGTPFATAMGFTDVVLDIAVPANRADLMSVRGLAREIATIVGTTAKFSSAKLKAGQKKNTVSVSVAAPQLCRVYTARTIRGLTVKSSPAWLQNYLRAAGMRSVNVLVDVTNYIMLEYGQPLHAFDAAKVQGRLTVRPAIAGERLITLDGIARSLDSSMLVIADTTGPIALAGVMGGQYTEVTDQTTDIILESAIFHPVSVRRTSRKLGLVSEASKRFEKGLCASLPEEASQAAAALIVELCGGVAENVVVVGKTTSKPAVIAMSPKYISERLGMTVVPATAKKILTKLGFTAVGATNWKITVPNWRLDVVGPDDIVDEVGKMVGYEELPVSYPVISSIPGPLPTMVEFKEKIRNILYGLGAIEIITHAYYGQRQKSTARHFEVQNPLDQTQQYLRASLLPVMDKQLWQAADKGQDVLLFELGRVFTPSQEKNVVLQQPWKLAIGMTYKRTAQGSTLRSVSEELLGALGVPINTMIKPAMSGIEMKGRLAVSYEFDCSELRKLSKALIYQSTSDFPSVKRDVSVEIPKNFDFDESLQSITKALGSASALLRPITASWYDDGKTRSIKYTITLQSMDRTLTKDEVDAAMKTVTEVLVKLGATIR